VEAVDLLPLEAGLEGEVEVAERLHGGEPGGAHGGDQAAGIAERDLRAEQRFEGVGGPELPAVNAGEDGVQGFQRAGHLEVGELRPQALAQGGGRLHTPAPASAA
jgi:hypothetical protein